VVTVEFLAVPEGTDLLLIHERLPAGAAEPHTAGWGRIVDLLARELAGAADPSPERGTA
jgi:hypothetical protein